MKTVNMFKDYQSGTGYKVLRKKPNGYSGPCYNNRGMKAFILAESVDYELDKLYTPDSPRLIKGGTSLYAAGFHIVKTYREAILLWRSYGGEMTVEYPLVIVKVNYTMAFADGIDESGYECVVSGDMSLVKEVPYV
jgi:hypothetical protein